MKKLLVSVSILTLAMVGLAEAGSRMVGSPKATTGEALHTADYGGVDISTGAFVVGHVTATINGTNLSGSGAFHGVLFSSGINTDFVDIYDSSATHLTTSFGHIARIYNISSSTAGVGSLSSGLVGLEYPIRFKRGLIWQPSNSNYNIISVLYNQD